MNKIQYFCRTYSLSIVTGILIGTSYIPLPPWAQLFCFVPLWWSWQKANSYKQIFMMGWLAQWFLTLIGFNWVSFTVHEFGGLPWPVAIVVLFLYCAIANMDLPIAGLVWFYLRKRFPTSAKMQILRLAVLTALMESWVPTLFPWNYGYPWLWVGWPVAQMSEVVGFQGLSSLMILLNVGAYWTFANWQHLKSGMLSKWVWVRPFAIAIGVFLFMNLMGWALLKTLPAPDKKLTAVITQANIGNQMKVASEQGRGFRDHIFRKYVDLTEAEILRGPSDLIMWPETALPYEFDYDNGFSMPIQTLFEKSAFWKSYLLTGGYAYSDKVDKVTNSLIVIDPVNGIQRNHYYKTILLAFGEYIPFGETFPNLYNMIPAGNFRRGGGPMTTTIRVGEENVLLGPQICYESLFPYFSRGLAEKGAQVIVNVTNDSWYGTWQEPYQHLYMTMARAVEFRRPLIRSTNTGISAVGLADGTVLNPSPMAVEWVGRYEVPYYKESKRTVYQTVPWLMSALLLIALALGLRKSVNNE